MLRTFTACEDVCLSGGGDRDGAIHIGADIRVDRIDGNIPRGAESKASALTSLGLLCSTTGSEVFALRRVVRGGLASVFAAGTLRTGQRE